MNLFLDNWWLLYFGVSNHVWVKQDVLSPWVGLIMKIYETVEKFSEVNYLFLRALKRFQYIGDVFRADIVLLA